MRLDHLSRPLTDRCSPEQHTIGFYTIGHCGPIGGSGRGRGGNNRRITCIPKRLCDEITCIEIALRSIGNVIRDVVEFGLQCFGVPGVVPAVDLIEQLFDCPDSNEPQLTEGLQQDRRWWITQKHLPRGVQGRREVHGHVGIGRIVPRWEDARLGVARVQHLYAASIQVRSLDSLGTA